MIDYAEALTVIDVNSGSFIGRGKGAGLEDTITKTNLEAAEEVVNQLRLRDIGGIIVIDFIDMARARNRDAVMKTLRKTLDEDRTKTFTAEISKLGLVEMTRQNVTEGVREIMSRPCPDLRGRGRDPLGGDDRDRVRAPAARRRRRTPRRRGVPRADQPAREHRSSPATARACCTRSRRRPASRSCSRAPKGSRSTTSRSPSWAPARRSRSARCRSARATRCWWRSSSRTCTTSTTRSPKSTATSSRSPAPSAHVGEKRMVRIDQVGRTAASALLLDESGEVVSPPARPTGSRAGRARQRRRAPAHGALARRRRVAAVAASARRSTARTPRHAAKPG